MILPSSSSAAFFLLIVSLLCLGSWTSLQKMLAKRRFERFYVDFTLGAVLLTVLAALTLGAMDSQELSFLDNFMLAGLRKLAWAGGAGLAFNLANILLVAGISLTGLSVSFPIVFGMALAVGSTWNYVSNPHGSVGLLFGGVALGIVAAVLAAVAYGSAADPTTDKPKPVDPRGRKPKNSGSGILGIGLSVLSGLLMGCVVPLVEWAREGETGLGPYGIAVVFVGMVLVTTFIFVPVLMMFPVNGSKLKLSSCFKGGPSDHLIGVLAGVIWAVGLVAGLVAAAAPSTAQASPAFARALTYGAAALSAVLGLVVWSEYRNSTSTVKLLLFGSVLVFIAAAGLVAVAPGV